LHRSLASSFGCYIHFQIIPFSFGFSVSTSSFLLKATRLLFSLQTTLFFSRMSLFFLSHSRLGFGAQGRLQFQAPSLLFAGAS
jgi:hypothetical protein